MAGEIDKRGVFGVPDKKALARSQYMNLGSRLWDLLGLRLNEGKIIQPYQRAELPIGKKMSLTAERGMGLFGQWERPDWRPDFENKDIRLTLSRNF